MDLRVYVLFISLQGIVLSTTPPPKRVERQAFKVSEISIQVTAPLFTGRLYEYGAEAGDRSLPPGVDLAQSVALAHPVSFFGQAHSSIFVTSNGALTFAADGKHFQTLDFPEGPRMIAPFYNQNDLAKGGKVFYRQVTEGRVRDRCESEVRYQYEKRVDVLSVLLVTWEDMHPVQNLESAEYEANTFQAAIISTGNETYVNYIYKKIGWSKGAQAGFNEGNGRGVYILPDGDANAAGNILLLAERGNTGIPGEWIFRIDMPRVIRCKPGIQGDLCDQRCAKGRWGYDCSECCHCESGACEPATGHCKAGDKCSPCWLGAPTCSQKDQTCRVRVSSCGANAISLSEEDVCGETQVNCRCLTGYTGDGFTCTDVDECDTVGDCDQNAVCVNTPGKYYCQCLEGFRGDGKTCRQDFLYPYEDHHALPKTLDVRAPWRLRSAVKVYGEIRETLWISSNGLVAFEDPHKVTPAKLTADNPGIQGFVPFFTRIDLGKGGLVTADESTDTGVLARATKLISAKFNMPNFVAESVFIVTFFNVKPHVNTNGNKENTFQVALIKGKRGREDGVFLEYLYEKLEYTNGAKAFVLADDPATSIELPGSGKSGAVQLQQLSNIGEPGHWVFRVDQRLQACPTPSMIPPYCEDDQRNNALQPRVVSDAPRVLFELTRTTRVPVPTPPIAPISTSRDTAPTPTVATQGSTDETVYTFNLPDFINIVPELVTKSSASVVVNSGSPTIRPSFLETTPSSRQPIEITEATTIRTTTDVRTLPASTVFATIPALKPQTPVATWATPNARPKTTPPTSKSNLVFGHSIPTQLTDRPQPPIHVFTTKAPRTTESHSQNVPILRPGGKYPNSIVTAPPRGSVPTLRNGDRKVEKHYPPGLPEFVEKEEDVSDPNTMAIVIPTVIVGVWLLLLIAIGVGICLKRRGSLTSSRPRPPAKYLGDPYSQIRMMQGPPARTTKEISLHSGALARHQHHASYEDHLDKAARVSEMNQYGQNGRHYTSYWQTPASARSGASTSTNYYNQGYYESCPDMPQPQTTSRYSFGGSRY